MSTKLQRVLLAILLISAPAFSQSIFRCIAPEVEGFGHERDVAERYIGRYFTDGMKVYATAKKGTLYVQGNYIRPGASNPTKLTTDYRQITGLQLIEWLYRDYPDGDSDPARGYSSYPTTSLGLDALRGSAWNHARVDEILKTPLFVDSSIFASDFGGVFHDFQNVQVIDKEGIPHRTVTISDESGSTERTVVAKDNYMLPMTELDNLRAIEHLRKLPLNHSRLRVLSMIVNNDTEIALRASVPREYRVDFDPTIGSAYDLVAQIRRQSGDTVFLIGHVEGQDIVTRSPDGNEISRASIAHLQDAARSNNVTLFVLGCDSAFQADVGVVGVFNSVDVVHKLATALKQDNVGDFLMQITPRDTSLLLRRDAVAGAAIEIYDLSRDRKRVGTIILPSALATVIFNTRIIEVIGAIFKKVLDVLGDVLAFIIAIGFLLLMLSGVVILQNPALRHQIFHRQPRIFQIELATDESSEADSGEIRAEVRLTPEQLKILQSQWPESANDGK